MAYSTQAAAESRVRGPALTSSSIPTATEAAAFGLGVAGEIDTALASHGVTVPVTTPAAFLAWLVELETVGWAARIAAVMYADSAGENSDESAAKLDRWYQAGLARLWDGSAIPPSLAMATAVLPTSYSVQYPDDAAVVGTDIGANAAGAFAEFEL